ncbi:MAG: GH25 family lysozyme, partial [Ruminococcus sp.]
MKKQVICTLLSILLIFSVLPISVNASVELDFEPVTESLLLVDTKNDKVLYEKNADEKRPMASTTKIMTYIVVAEAIDNLENTMIEIKEEPLKIIEGTGASVAGLDKHIGDKYSALDLLYCLMLPSGCDASVELADFVGNGDYDLFIKMMNDKAKDLGCNDTHFEDCNGLIDENHYTTANDMYKITKYAQSLPYFKTVTSTPSYTLKGDSVPMFNTNYMVDRENGGKYYYKYATGVKTGSTDLAGKCLVSSAEKGDTELICVALKGDVVNGTNTAMMESKKLFQWGFKNFTDNIEIEVDKRYLSIEKNKKVTLNTNIISNSTNSEPIISYSSSNTEIADIDSEGVITGHKLGQAVIKVTTQTGNFDYCIVSCGYKNGIDVTSNYGDYSSGVKNPINWKALSKYGLDFAIIRAGWGSEDYPNQNDAEFVTNVKGAVENNIDFGLSFISYAVDKETAKAEAEYLLREIKDYIPEYSDKIAFPIAYNMSNKQFLNMSSQQNTEIAIEFSNVLKENGYDTMIYGNKKLFNNINVNSLKENGIGLWYAYYPYEADFSQEILINDSVRPDFWQY